MGIKNTYSKAKERVIQISTTLIIIINLYIIREYITY